MFRTWTSANQSYKTAKCVYGWVGVYLVAPSRVGKVDDLWDGGRGRHRHPLQQWIHGQQRDSLNLDDVLDLDGPITPDEVSKLRETVLERMKSSEYKVSWPKKWRLSDQRMLKIENVYLDVHQ